MNSNLATALGYITSDEGPEVNISPDEPGGASRFGCTLLDLSEYRKTQCTIDDIKGLTKDEANTIYSTKFAIPIQFDALPSGVDYRVLDLAVTLGVSGACTLVQMALLMWPITGVMDNLTIANIKTEDSRVLLASLDAAWLSWKHGMTPDGWRKYGHGWINRVINVRSRYTAMLGT